MPNITDFTFFNKPNVLNIALATTQPSTVTTVANPSNQKGLENTITAVENDVLINSLGLTIYNELQTALEDLPSADQKWKDLVNGVEYDGKKWEGLDNDLSLLCFATYFLFMNGNTQFQTAVGIVQVNSENSNVVSPNYKLANAWQAFVDKYQGSKATSPLVYNINGSTFTDYYGINGSSVFVSLYEYLVDKKDDFSWSPEDFVLYNKNANNSFGI